MTIDEIIEVLIIERTCVERQDSPFCDRHCEKCDLCMPTDKVVKAYEQAVDQLHKVQKYRKKAKRWKRKYLDIKQILGDVRYGGDAE